MPQNFLSWEREQVLLLLPSLNPRKKRRAEFDRRDAENTGAYRRRLIRQLERLGHKITLEPLPEAA